METHQEDQINSDFPIEFYQDKDGKLLAKYLPTGEYKAIDFDITKEGVLRADVSQPPINKNKKIEDNELKIEHDLTMQQVEEDYYPETSKTKTDGSFAMFETRVAKVMEAKGISREQARKEVRKRMEQDGRTVTNTEDMDKEMKTEEEEEEETKKKTDMEESEDKITIDALKKENEKLKQDLEEAKKTNETMKKDFKETMDFVEQIKKERAEELETKRQAKIDQIVTDFVGISREELENDSMESLLRTERLLEKALKKEEPKEPTQDMQSHLDMVSAKAKELEDRYNCKI